ncbi:MAG TPA: ABATE domain-containing protein [Steroidobacteraceae bacterium]|nr:ABATE domain-containing protein [Steroidobacteraceae bacterium]
MQVVTHEFVARDFIAGHIALDFANTVTARDTAPRDWLDGYARLLDWAVKAGVVYAAAATRLGAIADRSPREAAAALGRARKVREALHDICVALLTRKDASAAALEELESAWKRAAARAHMTGKGLLRLQPDAETSGLDLPLDLVVFAAVDLLGELDADRTRVCRGHDCGWLFIDSSKGGRRVWCDMGTCGNAAKGARFARADKRRRRTAQR